MSLSYNKCIPWRTPVCSHAICPTYCAWFMQNPDIPCAQKLLVRPILHKQTYLLSFPFHCLNRSVFVTFGSSENHNSFERGGRMYGSSGSSDTISTFRHNIMTLIRAKSFKRQISKCSHWLSACRLYPPLQARWCMPYPGSRISSPDGSGCSKSSSASTNEQEWNMTWYPEFRNWLSFQSCKQQNGRGEFSSSLR